MKQIITVLRRINLRFQLHNKLLQTNSLSCLRRTQDAENVDLLLIMIPQLISLIILKNKTLKNQQKKKKMLAWRLLELQDFSFLMSEAGKSFEYLIVKLNFHFRISMYYD